jgi:5S rRNA maturation endonuclease (ribonuclease M5)
MRSAANILQEHGGSEADPIVAAYDYPDESGQVLFQKVRTAAKRFWQRRPNGNGNWINDTKGVRKLIYQLPQVVEAIGNDEIVVVVEDEKDADNLIKLGVRATCSQEAAKPGQKPKWRPEYSELLRDADVVVILDHDEPGRAHAQATAESLQGIARRVRVLDLAAHWPQCKEGGDVSDWLAAGQPRHRQAAAR